MTETATIILNLAKQGKTPKQIAAIAHCYLTYVYKVCRDHEVTLQKESQTRPTGVIPLCQNYRKTAGKSYRFASIPQTALRAAGFLQEQSLHFHLEATSKGVRIIVERCPQIPPPTQIPQKAPVPA